MKKVRKPRRRVSIDVSDWELGDWPERLKDVIKVKAQTVEIDFDPGLEEVTREIAREAIEAFFEDPYFVVATSNGIKIEGGAKSESTLSKSITIPWDRIFFDGHVDPRASIEKWVSEQEEQCELEPRSNAPARDKKRGGE